MTGEKQLTTYFSKNLPEGNKHAHFKQKVLIFVFLSPLPSFSWSLKLRAYNSFLLQGCLDPKYLFKSQVRFLYLWQSLQ